MMFFFKRNKTDPFLKTKIRSWIEGRSELSDGSRCCFLNTLGSSVISWWLMRLFLSCCPQFPARHHFRQICWRRLWVLWLCPTLSVNTRLRVAGASAGWLAATWVSSLWRAASLSIPVPLSPLLALPALALGLSARAAHGWAVPEESLV